MPETKLHIRWMIRRDMPEVFQIEQDSFEFPWSEEDFIRTIQARDCIGMVAEYGDKIVGFMVYQLHKSRLHVLNFAVHPIHRGESIGRKLFTKLTDKLASYRRKWITAAIRESNLPGQIFARAMGMRAVNVKRGYYADTEEDAYWMRYEFGNPYKLEEQHGSQEAEETEASQG